MGNESLGQKLKKLRLSKHESQVVVANSIGCTVKTYREWEHDTNIPRSDYLDALVKHFNVDMDYLIGRIQEGTHDKKFICQFTGLSESAVDMLHSIKTDGYEGDKTLAVLNLLLSDPCNNKRSIFNDSGYKLVQSMSNRLIDLLYSYIFTDSLALVSNMNNLPKDKAIVASKPGLVSLDIEPLYKEHLINSIRDELNKYANKDGKDKGKKK